MNSFDTEDSLDMPDELTTLKARADLLGLHYHPSIGLDKLRDKVNSAAVSEDGADTSQVLAQVAAESAEELRVRKRKEAGELLRLRVSCMNPAKKEWDGEIFTAGNAVVGTFKKYVPYNNEDGWHVPRIIYNQLVQRQCQIFVAIKDDRGNTKRMGKVIREFAVEIMPPLSLTELHDLAQRQAMAKAID